MNRTGLQASLHHDFSSGHGLCHPTTSATPYPLVHLVEVAVDDVSGLQRDAGGPVFLDDLQDMELDGVVVSQSSLERQGETPQ